MRRSDRTGAVVSGMRKYKTKTSVWLMHIAFCMAAGVLLTGCGLSREDGYTREDLQNTAKLELYEAGSGKLLKTIEDEETLYQYIQAAEFSEDGYEAETEKERKETAENAGETYHLVVYKYPAAKFGNKAPEENCRITLYQDVNIAKMVVKDTVVKNIALPEELLTFYYEMSEEEQAFYESLVP